MMVVVSDARDRAAALLRDAESARTPMSPLSEHFDGLTLDDAYAIQRINLDLRLSAGERLVGHKIGLTSEAMQRMLGVDVPDVGSITDRMVIANGADFDGGELIAGHVEAEFAFRIAQPLRTTEVSYDELKAAVSHVALSIEIIDSRIRDWRIGLVDTVADNASSARIVVGPWQEATGELLQDLPARTISLHEDDAVIGEGPGAAVMGDPLRALLWLARTLARQNIALDAGDVVLAGSVHRMQPLRPGRRYSVSASGFDPAGFNS